MGNKETKEVMVAFLGLAAMLAETFKDGVQMADFQAIMDKVAANTELRMKIEEAYKDIEMVKQEVVDLSLVESLDLIQAGLPEIKKLLAAIKK